MYNEKKLKYIRDTFKISIPTIKSVEKDIHWCIKKKTKDKKNKIKI